MTTTDLCFKTLTELSDLIKRKEVSPVEATKAILDRIETIDDKLHSYLMVLPETAMQKAQEAEQAIMRGEYRGPLHGVPLAVKDLCFTKGIRTTCASKILADWVPDYDATVVTRLKAAGAVLLGKLAMTEFAYAGYHPSYQPPLNPWDPGRWPGASSSGSGVATAAGLCFGSLGSDTGGSIRFPSACCGIVGIKQTYGRVSRYGVFPLAESLDHVGPMTRSVADAAAILRTIAGFDPNDPTSLQETVRDYLLTLKGGIRNVRIGVDEAYCKDQADPEVSTAVLATIRVLRDLGAVIEEVSISGVDEALPAWFAICAAETAAAHEKTFPSQADDYGPTFRAFLQSGVEVSGAEYAKAHVTRQALRRTISNLFQKVDLLLCPSTPTLPMRIEDFQPQGVFDQESLLPLLRTTAPFDLTGSPTISVPCGFTSEGLPISLQLVGRHLEEALLCQAGYAYEQATEWHKRRPPV
jgi:amidase